MLFVVVVCWFGVAVFCLLLAVCTNKEWFDGLMVCCCLFDGLMVCWFVVCWFAVFYNNQTNRQTNKQWFDGLLFLV